MDLGPLLGITTNVLARGLEANPRSIEKRKRIFSFDLFLAEGMGHYTESYGEITGSVCERFLEINADYRDLIFLSPGDFGKMLWGAGPIEVCLIDIAKTPDLNFHVIDQMFPSLAVGAAVAQQDYVYFDQYWIAYTMEYFADHFSAPEFLFGSTACFYLEKTISQAECHSFRLLSFDERLALMEQAISKAPPSVSGVLQCGKAKMLLDAGRTQDARTTLSHVKPMKHHDPVSDFSAIAESNYQMVAAFLDR